MTVFVLPTDIVTVDWLNEMLSAYAAVPAEIIAADTTRANKKCFFIISIL